MTTANRFAFWALLCLPWPLAAQNMVPNPSFETFSAAPTTFGQITNASPWQSAYGSSDLFHTSAGAGSVGVPANYFGNQAPHTGNAYSGIAWSNSNSYHEYLRVMLTSPLTIGNSYYCEAYVSAGEGPYRYGVNNFGFLLTTSAMSGGAGDPPISTTPQVNWTTPITDYTSWTLVSGTFTATAAAQHLTMGSFYSVASTTWSLLGTAGSINSQYWFIDDVVVQPNTVLPVNLQGLKATLLTASQVEVSWHCDDQPGAHQSVERSADQGATWQSLRAGITANGQHHSLVDAPSIYQTPLLYRVRQVDADGTITRSQPVGALLESPGLAQSLAVSPQPTPSGQEVTVRWASNLPGEAHVGIFSLDGKLEWETAQHHDAGNCQLTLPSGLLAPGLHILKVTAAGESQHLRLMVTE